jgi:hypothetical protein
MNETFSKSINDLYIKRGYFNRYAFDIWKTMFLLFIATITISYFHIQNHLQSIRTDWENQRCNPSVMAFAGWIQTPPSTQTRWEFTEQNFVYCSQSILQNISKYAFVPIYYLSKTMTEGIEEISNSMNSMRSMFDKVRNSTHSINDDVYSRSLNVTAPLVESIVYMKHMMGKTQATLTASVYTLFGSYLALTGFFLFLYDLLIDVMLIMVSFIISCFAVGWLFPPTLAVGLTASAFLAALLVPVVIIQIFISNTFKVNKPSPPGVPSYHHCFGHDTEFYLQKRTDTSFSIFSTPIYDIQPNDILEDGSRVISVLTLSAFEQPIYKLYGCIVTGNHKVYSTIHNQWIDVKDHPDSILLNEDDYPYSHVYCMTTDTKQIRVKTFNQSHYDLYGGLQTTLFTDWDEEFMLDPTWYSYLKKKHELPDEYPLAYYTARFTSGLHPSTQLELKDGRIVNIEEICVHDELKYGEKILGLVKIDTSDVEDYVEYTYTYFKNEMKVKEISIKTTQHTYIHPTKTHGCKHYTPQEPELILTRTTLPKDKIPQFSYHLITNTGSIQTDHFNIEDYHSNYSSTF